LEVARLNLCAPLPIVDEEPILDSMLGWLARWLRMLGVHAIYSPSFNDESLLSINHLLITRDRELFRKRSLPTLLLETSIHEEWLSISSLILGTQLVINMDRSLCPICGSKLVKVSREAVVNKVPGSVLLKHDSFWLCTGCGKVYWVGSHHMRIGKELEIARYILSRLKASCVGNNLLIIHNN